MYISFAKVTRYFSLGLIVFIMVQSFFCVILTHLLIISLYRSNFSIIHQSYFSIMNERISLNGSLYLEIQV